MEGGGRGEREREGEREERERRGRESVIVLYNNVHIQSISVNTTLVNPPFRK